MNIKKVSFIYQDNMVTMDGVTVQIPTSLPLLLDGAELYAIIHKKKKTIAETSKGLVDVDISDYEYAATEFEEAQASKQADKVSRRKAAKKELSIGEIQITRGGNIFPGDRDSQIDMMILLQVLDDSEETDILTVDGYVTISKEDVAIILKAAVKRRATILKKGVTYGNI